jgi:hypothetical protein
MYRWRHGRWPDLDCPQRFTEWVQWRKLNDRNVGLARLTDKDHSKRIAAELVGDEMVVPTLWMGQTLPASPPWPIPFVIKANHGCGQFLVVRDETDWERARALAPGWLASRYGGLLGEWHYSIARPALLVEPFIGEDETLPLDYKIYVFGGQAVMVQLHEGRATDHRWSQFDRNWRPLSESSSDRRAPASLGAMLDAAETLAAGFDFLRVDLYEIEGRPLFGEFCLFPGSGLDPFAPVDLDFRLGERWRALAPWPQAACSSSLSLASSQRASAS